MYFVFGGDVVDHGEGDIRIAKALIRFKKKYPDRVFLVAGNRDVNKMLLTSRLWETFERDKEAGASKLRDILKITMGAPNAFEFRRKELAILSGVGLDAVTDIDVATSYYESVAENGFMRSYLEHAQLAVLLFDSLFLHGAVPENGIGFVPSNGTPQALTAKEWISCLNQFYNEQLDMWNKNPRVREDGVGGYLLTEYGKPGGLDGRGVLYNDWLEKGGTLPARIPRSVANYLLDSGIRRVVSGHRPHGDTPTVIREEETDFIVVTADTSYSDKTAPDNRGKAVSEILVDISTSGDKVNSSTRIRGIRKDGTTQLDFVVELDPSVGCPLSAVARKSSDTPSQEGWLKAALPSEGEYLACFSRGPNTFSSDLDYRVVNLLK
eukprot:CAMPEP_0203759750 /NCGR_PEP_ID=MMETSP0098-20131031/12916_1 /ASSEMBLY_ACC=CAM_ASM_000208 /TAXON_ID=96639 /ORGANISM=" , Strain NY0313808BC1" /LENGTH=379 /DNA_ID=CAMNT_0050652921 /DNA_START=1240 /DNA_END=2379 /DNA_ORIENTATION=+